LTAGAGSNLSVAKGATFSGTLATFTDANTQASVSDFTALVDWGDGIRASENCEPCRAPNLPGQDSGPSVTLRTFGQNGVGRAAGLVPAGINPAAR